MAGPATASEIIEILTFRSGFNTSVVVAGTALLGLAAGVVGVFALLRNRSLLADAVSHATLPGITIAFLVAGYLGLDNRSLPVLLIGAAMSGTAGATAIHLIVRYSRLHEDAAIGIVLSVFFGCGIVLLSYIQSAAATGSAGLNSFIYGQAATMRLGDVALMGSIALVAVLVAGLLHKELAITCFNDAFARVDGWPVSLLDLIIVGLVVLVTVAGLQAVGLLMVVAMLIIPPAAARFWTDRLWVLIVLAGLIGAGSGYLGSAISAAFPGNPAGAVIVLASGFVFVVSMLAAPGRGVVASIIRRTSVRFRIAGDHLLEAAHNRSAEDLSLRDLSEIAHERGWSSGFLYVLRAILIRGGMLTTSGRGGGAVTKAGMARGARVSRNHALWEQYLISHADIAPSHVDWSVDQVEHALSPDLIERLEAALAESDAPSSGTGRPTQAGGGEA